MVAESNKAGERPFTYQPMQQNPVAGGVSPVSLKFNTESPAIPLSPFVQPNYQQYGRYTFNFSDVLFGSKCPPSSSSLLESVQGASKYLSAFASNDINQVKAVPSDLKSGFDQMAVGLGFKNFKALQYQCRNLPAPVLKGIFQQIEKAINKLPTEERTATNMQQQANAIFFAAVNDSIQQLFNRCNIPEYQQPQFFVRLPDQTTQEDNDHRVNPKDPKDLQQWNPVAMLGAYNALSEIAAQSPALLQQVAINNNNGPLALIRSEKHHNLSQFAGPDNQLNLMELLTGAMQVSYKQGGSVVLQDGAISMSARSVMRPEIERQLALINAPHVSSTEKEKAIQGLQQLLNYSRPGQELKLTGVYDTATQNAVKQFKVEQMLTRLQETLEDDASVSSPQNLKWIKSLNRLRIEIRNNRWAGSPPYSAEEAQKRIKTVLANIQAQGANTLGAHTLTRLDELEKALAEPITDKFDEKAATNLIDNWFDIIDTGGGMNFTEQVMVHEMGHILQDTPGIMKNWEQISWKSGSKTLTSETAPNEAMGATLNHRPNDACCMKGFASAYARTNADEDFAESFRVFTYQPQRLMKDSFIKFVFLNGLTQTYSDEQVVTMAKQAGYTTRELQKAVASIRGNLDDVLQQQREENVSNFSKTAQTLAKTTGNPLFHMVALGAEVLKGPISEGARMIKGWWAGEYDTSLQLEMKFAAANPKMDSLLGIDSTKLRTPPKEEGFILEFLSNRQFILATPDSDPAQQKQAAQEIERFLQKGVDFFEPAVANQFPPEIRTLFGNATTPSESSKSNRAVLVALSKIVGLGRAKSQWEKLEGRHPDATRKLTELNRFFTDIKSPDKMKALLGDNIYERLPAPFKVMLADPPFVKKLTGNTDQYGESNVSLSTITKTVFTEISSRKEKAEQEMVDTAKMLLVEAIDTWMQRKTDDGANPSDNRWLKDAYQLYVDLMERYNSAHVEDSYRPMGILDFARSLEHSMKSQQGFKQEGALPEGQADSRYHRAPDGFDETQVDQLFKKEGTSPTTTSFEKPKKEPTIGLA